MSGSAKRRPSFSGYLGSVYDRLLPGLFIICIAALVYQMLLLWQVTKTNRIIDDLKAGYDVAVDLSAEPELLFARGYALVQREDFDASYPILDALSRRAPESRERSDLLYDLANARLRSAYLLADQNRFTDAVPLVDLAKDELRRALRINPDDWNYKHNLDVALQLVRDFPNRPQAATDEKPESPEELWTDLPGRPGGLP